MMIDASSYELHIILQGINLVRGRGGEGRPLSSSAYYNFYSVVTITTLIAMKSEIDVMIQHSTATIGKALVRRGKRCSRRRRRNRWDFHGAGLTLSRSPCVGSWSARPRQNCGGIHTRKLPRDDERSAGSLHG